jgi:hypothetical protein
MGQIMIASFSTGAILTLVLPVAILALVGIYWAVVFMRRGFEEEL